MKIAILHEMLVKIGGAEKVVEAFLEAFPEADLFTLMYNEEQVSKVFPKESIHPQCFKLPSQKRYSWTKKQRLSLNLMAGSVEQLDFSQYDIVLCSSSAFAHGAITKPETKFIVYYHAPARYMWDWTNEYKRDIGWERGLKRFFLNSFFLKTRQWDITASHRVDISLANSKNTQNRIQKYHRKNSEVVYPPIETKRFMKKVSPQKDGGIFPRGEKQEYYIIISALTEFKKIEIAIDAFKKMPQKHLLIIGDGDYRKNLETRSGTSLEKNIFFLGKKYGIDMVALLQQAKGFIFPGEEDFGITPLEAHAAGVPVFSYRGGGLLETNIEGKTGEFFDDKDGEDFIEHFERFEKNIEKKVYKKKTLQENARRFSREVFIEKMKDIVAEK